MPEFRTLTPRQIREHTDAFLAIAADIAGEYWGLENFLAERRDKWRLSFALWQTGQPIGYAIVSRLTDNNAHLHHFMLAKSWRGRGLGKHMAVEMEWRLRADGIATLSLKAHELNTAARRFYTRLGYDDLGSDGDYRVLEKSLGSNRPTIVAIHQPNYAPWLGYFHKIARADNLVFLDDAQYSKNSYINRVRVLRAGEARWLTVPVRAHLGDPIDAVHPARADWVRAHLDALAQFYRAAPAFDAVWGEVRALYEALPADTALAETNRRLVEGIAGRLGLRAQFLASSELALGQARGDDRLIAIVKALAPGGAYLSGRGGAKYQEPAKFADAGIKLEYTDFEHPEYDQGGGDFVAGLSVLDAVFHAGWAEAAAMVAAGTD